ncbi:hypothetical protein LZ31DRAFT_369485 [Colletotrichum somersetense]|nr:hypothetical protein LZ31DRAFT_369485 [Colletotrichum somersetense]
MKAIPLALLLLFPLLWLLPYLRIHNIKVTECLLVPHPITPQNYSGVNDPNPWRESHVEYTSILITLLHSPMPDSDGERCSYIQRLLHARSTFK